MIKQGPKKHIYVSLHSVFMVALAGTGLLAIGCFLAAFIYRMGLNYDEYQSGNPDVTYDVFNLSNNFNSYVLVISIFAIILMMLFLLARAIYTLNNPNTIMVTLQFVNAN